MHKSYPITVNMLCKMAAVMVGSG